MAPVPWPAGWASRCGLITKFGCVIDGSGNGAIAADPPGYFACNSSNGPQSSARDGHADTHAGS